MKKNILKLTVISLLLLSISTISTAKKSITAEISYGEFIDKITILEIKTERIKNPIKLKNVKTELEILMKLFHEQIELTAKLNSLKQQLKKINEKLWKIEDDIRAKEQEKTFDAEFIELARRVYITNDKRGKIKREINELLGSELVEEKEYTEYQ